MGEFAKQRKKERERERARQRERERARQRETDTHAHTHAHTDRQTDRHAHTTIPQNTHTKHNILTHLFFCLAIGFVGVIAHGQLAVGPFDVARASVRLDTKHVIEPCLLHHCCCSNSKKLPVLLSGLCGTDGK